MDIKTIVHKKVGKLIIRPMFLDDVPGVYKVESCSYDYPWSEKLLHDCVAVGYDCWVIECNNTIIAYAIYRLALDEAHLFNIAVLPKYQNKKLGKIFLEFLLARMKNNHAKNVILEVRESNFPALKLYKNLGFNKIGIRKDYYPAANNTREDGINLELIF